MGSLGLWRAVIIRLRADWPVVLAAWALLLCATIVLTAGTAYADAVALGSIRGAVAAAPPAGRSIVAEASVQASQVATLDASVHRELDRVIGLPGGEVATIVRADPFALTAAGRDASQVVTVASYEGIERHATLVTGAWPAVAASGAQPETALPEGAAAALGVGVGDSLRLTDRVDPSLSVAVRVVGIWRATAAADPYWLGSTLEIDGTSMSGGYTTIGPVLISPDDIESSAFGTRRNVEWREIVDPNGFQLDNLDTVRAAVDALPPLLASAVPPSTQIRVRTQLSATLASVSRGALVGRTGMLLVEIPFAALGAYAILLVAGMLADRRRSETALLRSRGASSGHLATMTIVEAVVLAGSAAVIAPLVAAGALLWLGGSGSLAGTGVDWRIGLGSDVLLVDAITAAACVIALTVPVLGSFPSLAGARSAISRQAGRTLARRLGLDLALVVVAGIALWQLRRYGALQTRNLQGVIGVDPLLVAAPGLGLVAGAVLATRLIPRLAELLERALQGRRGLVASLGSRGLARRPLRQTRSALLLLLATALVTFTFAHVATWQRSQTDQAAYQAGADLRYMPSVQVSSLATLGASLRGLPDVSAVMPVDRSLVDAGRDVRGASLLTIDAGTVAGITPRTFDVAGEGLPDLFHDLATTRPATAGATIPAGTRQLSVVLDAAFSAEGPLDPSFFPDLSTIDGITASFVIATSDGRLQRLIGVSPAVLSGGAQRISTPLSADAIGATASAPLRLVAVELAVSPPSETLATAAIQVDSLEATGGDPSQGPGVAWTALDLHAGDPAWGWQQLTPGKAAVPYAPPASAPWRVDFGAGAFTIDRFQRENTVTARLSAEPAAADPIAAIASRGFLDATGAAIGDTVSTNDGVDRLDVRIVGVVSAFPTLDPNRPFLVLDGPTTAAARFAASGTIDDPTEWWLASTDPATAGAAILAGPDPNGTIVSRAAIETTLATDPTSLGVIAVMSLGSLAAMVFAAIGFIVVMTLSTRERLGEFAILRAMGLSARQLSTWLSAESAFLLGISVAAGVGLGLILAFVVLPVSLLTTAGALPVPPPVVVIPVVLFLPLVAAAAFVFGVTVVVMRSLLLQVRIGDVLRGYDA